MHVHAKYLIFSAPITAPNLTHKIIFNKKLLKLLRSFQFIKREINMISSNYRSKSISPILPLILERHANIYLKLYLKENNLLYRHSGFRENHLCQSALIKFETPGYPL